MSNPASNELSRSNEVASSSSLSLSNLSDLPEEIRNELIDIILRKVQEEIRLGNVDPNEIGPDGKTILERIGAMELLRGPSI